MMNTFAVTLEINDDTITHKNMQSADALAIFTAMPWNEDWKKCSESDDEFGSFFSVSYKDEHNLEFTFETELFVDDDNKNPNVPMKFSLTYLHQEIIIKKVLFGLFGEKEEVISKNIFMDDQNMEFTLRCLYAFLQLDHTFLTNNMYENFGTDVNE